MKHLLFTAFTVFSIGLQLVEGLADTPKTKIGMILPLTGPLAEFGTAVQNGVSLAFIDNSQLHSSCRIIFEDCEYQSLKAVSAFRKLTQEDKVQIVYNWGTVTSEPLAPIAEQVKFPLVVWAAEPEISRGRSHVLRFSNSAADYAGVVAKYLADRQKNKLALIVAETQYLQAMLNGLQSRLLPGQTLEVIANVNPSEQDFKTIISKLKAKKFKVVTNPIRGAQGFLRFNKTQDDRFYSFPVVLKVISQGKYVEWDNKALEPNSAPR